MIVLVDMDGVISDFEGAFLKLLKEKHPDKPYIELEDRNTFYVMEQYPEESRSLIWEIITSPGYFASLMPIAGSLDAVKEMAASGLDVSICSSPLIGNPTGASEKYDWVARHLGRDWMKRLILAPDKTLVRGDLLIDDRPEIKGSQTPTWEHIIFDQPYNRGNKERRRMTWDNWKDVILASKA